MSVLFLVLALLGPAAAGTPADSAVPAVQKGQLDLAAVAAEVARVEGLPWNALTEQDWSAVADTLTGYVEAMDRPRGADEEAQRALMFKACAQGGRAAENANNPRKPLYRQVGGQAVNYYWYVAATLAHRDATLMEGLPKGELAASIRFYVDKIEAGALPGEVRD